MSYKNPENPKCINLIMTNMVKSFQNSEAIEKGFSDSTQNAFNSIEFFLQRTKTTYSI